MSRIDPNQHPPAALPPIHPEPSSSSSPTIGGAGVGNTSTATTPGSATTGGETKKAASRPRDKVVTPRAAVLRSGVGRGAATGAGAARKAAAVAQYAVHGDTRHDLRSSQDVDLLIRRSPQLDDLTKTRTDANRCGAASVLNTLLLDGAYRQNAVAIAGAARSSRVRLSSADAQALGALRRGQLTPHQAARLQDLLYRVGLAGPHGKQPKPGGQEGLVEMQITQLVSSLRARGALSQTRRVTFHLQHGHWTVSHQASGGRQRYVDSMPDRGGQAKVALAPDKPLDAYSAAGAANWNFQGSVVVEPRGKQTHYRVRLPDRNLLHRPGLRSDPLEEKRVSVLTYVDREKLVANGTIVTGRTDFHIVRRAGADGAIQKASALR